MSADAANWAGYEKHVLVCTNVRPADNPKGCCTGKGSEAVLKRFKTEMALRDLGRRMRANSSGCLDRCAQGVSVVVYPDAVWYAAVREEDVPEIVERHLIGGEPVERLRMPATAP